VLSWLSTRLQQLLMYRWYEQKDGCSAASRARLFGDARKRVPKEAQRWKGKDLMNAIRQLARAEMQLKGSSVEDKPVVLERLVLNLIQSRSV